MHIILFFGYHKCARANTQGTLQLLLDINNFRVISLRLLREVARPSLTVTSEIEEPSDSGVWRKCIRAEMKSSHRGGTRGDRCARAKRI